MPRLGPSQPRLPPNFVAQHQAAGGRPRSAALGISQPTLKRWRRVGVVTTPLVLRWAALLHADPAAQLAVARRLAGLPSTPRRTP
jgi:hypothetical protein